MPFRKEKLCFINTIEEYEKIHFVTHIYAFYSSSDTLWMVFDTYTSSYN